MPSSVVRSRRRALIGFLLVPPTVVTSVLVAVTPAVAASTGGVVNEVYGGGGNSGATLKNDFIELANRGPTDLDVSTWSVQYTSAAGTSAWQVTPLVGVVPAGGLYLVGEAAGAGGTVDLPPTQAGGSIALSGTSGTVALVRGTTALTCTTALSCAADVSVVDLVGYGSAAIAEGAAAAGLSNTTSAQRGAGPDTDVNGADFAAAAPTPAATNSGGEEPPGGGTEPGPLRIHDIQGAAWLSPHDDEVVSGVPGIVIAVRASGDSRGYWIQDPTPDASPVTSEGVFVYTGSAAVRVAIGDSVLVAGTVNDFYPGGPPATNSNLSITEINQSGVTVLASARPLPAPVVVTARTVPRTYAPYVGGNLETTALLPARSALDFWESREGMRVEVDDVRVIGPTSRFGELFVTTKPNEQRTPRGGSVITGYATPPAGRIKVQPLGPAPSVNVGDVLAGATSGPVDYDQFGGYKIAATTVGARLDNGLTPTVAAPQEVNQLSVATYNVENLAPADAAAKYARLALGIVTNLATPDVLTVEEVQDNSGATDDGVVAADATLTKLTDAIVAAGGPRYRWRAVDPENDRDGGQPGGNIRVVFLYNPTRVSFVDTGIADATTPTEVLQYAGAPHLSLSPGRIAPTDPAWSTSRKPLVGEFLFRGRTVFVIGNHFVSKGGDQSADGRFQPPARTSEVQRQQQAALVHDFVADILRVDRRARVVVAGDLNDYQFSPTLNVLRTGTASGRGRAILTDLIDTLPVRQRYTYVFNGVSQVLDHILVTAGVGRVDYEVAHINAEFADQASDHDPQLVRLRIR